MIWRVMHGLVGWQSTGDHPNDPNELNVYQKTNGEHVLHATHLP